jgi:predicted RecA/RadA family phage recombinase
MATNFKQSGEVLTLTAPTGGVVSGEGVSFNDLFVVPLTTAAVGVDFAGQTVGVWSLAKKAADAMAIGDEVFWDASSDHVTSTSTGMLMIGYCVATAATSATSIDVRLAP